MTSILRKSLNFDFAAQSMQGINYLDPIIAFTRASTATRINPTTGLVETVATDVARINGRQELWKAGCKNLLAYSGELNNAGWNLHNNTTATKVSGGTRITGTASATTYWGQFVTYTQGATYTFTVRMKAANGVSNVVRLQGNGNSVSNDVSVGVDFQDHSFTFIADQYDQLVAIIRPSNDASFDIVVEHAQLELGATATAYEANPVVIQPGLLIEGAATNLFDYSQGSSGWGTDSGSVFVANDSTAPDGTGSALRIVPSGLIKNAYKMVTTPVAGKVVISIWARAVAGTVNALLVCNSNTGEGNTNASIILDAVWRRYYIRTEYTTAPGLSLLGIDSIQGEILVWGWQYETGTFPSSYIPTSGSAATRAADAASIDVSKIWNASEGTIVCEANVPAENSTMLDFGTNRLWIYRLPNGDVRAVFVNPLGPDIYLSAPGDRVRIAVSYNTTRTAFSLNGSAVVSDAGVAFSPATLYLGQSVGLADQAKGPIQALQYHRFAFDDLTLRAASEL